MKEKRNLHMKVQELCDCYATTDPLKEMSALRKDADRDEAALKWLALSALHGISANAKKITIQQSSDGTVTVNAKYRRAELPSPGKTVGEKIFKAVREITHLEGDKGKTPLSLGIRGNSMDLNVKIKKDKDGEKVTIKFPGS
ncbi:MAG: hypothetical protein AB1427_02680 [Thermodesulfobacteriota bacterium]